MRAVEAHDTFSHRELAAYGALGLPLAMAALPLYVHLPKFYADEQAVALTTVGVVLLLTRLVDAISDPLIGYWNDRSADRRYYVAASLPLLAFGMLALFHPPADPEWRGPWLAGTVIVTYLGFSLASIAYQAWGAELSRDSHERTRITATREGFALVGVVVAALMPSLLGGESGTGFARAAWGFALALFAAAAITLTFAPRRARAAAHSAREGALLRTIFAPFANRDFRWLIAVFTLSGIAAAIPSTLVLFFVADVIDAGSRTGLFLAIYFLAAACGLPLWLGCSRRIGKRGAWLSAMVLAIASFGWAFGLGAGDEIAFGIVCVLSGAALGADLALPASMLADVIDRDGRGATVATSGGYFGIWNLLTKANLGLAAGIALPLLGALGYSPGAGVNLGALSLTYCIVPCVFKCAAALVLWRAPLGGAPRND